MKFTLKTSSLGVRRGVITGIERLPAFQMETPNVLLYTQAGAVPHLTPDVVALLNPLPQAVILPISTISGLENRMKNTPLNIAQFIGLPHLLNMVSIVDPARARLEGFHKKDILAVQTRAGKKEYTPNSYMDFIGDMEPDLFMSLCDGDTKKESSGKRVEKSASRSQTMTEGCSARWQDSKLQQRGFLVPLEGGTNPKIRELYAADMKKYEAAGAAGVVIDGLSQHGPELASKQICEFDDCIEASLKNCGINGVRILPGAWHPSLLFHLIDLGIDLFDTSYPTMVTDRGGALIFPLQLESHHSPSKRAKPPTFEISLKDNENAECFEPVSTSCNCHCCKNHTRAYIHHLLNVNEMLASVLLNIHNLQQYLELFSAIRHSSDNGNLQQLKEQFLI